MSTVKGYWRTNPKTGKREWVPTHTRQDSNGGAVAVAPSRQATQDPTAASVAGQQAAQEPFGDPSAASMRDGNYANADLPNDLRGVDASDAWCQNANADGADLTGMMAPGSNWKAASLKEANLRDGDFSAALFDGADMQRTKVHGLRAPGVSLKNVAGYRMTGEGVVLDDADLFNADFPSSHLSGSMKWMKAEDTNFSGGFISGNLSELHAPRANFSGSIMRDVDAADSDVSSALFREVKGTQVRLSHANAAGAQFQDSTFDHLVLENADVTGVHCARMNASHLNLRGAAGSDASFVAATIPGVNARRSYLPRSVFRDADARGGMFGNSTLRGSDWRYADLDRTEFAGAHAERSSFAGSRGLGTGNIVGADFSGCDVSNADLSDADPSMLRSASWRGATATTGTRFPAGFDPEAAGIRVVDDGL